MKTLRFERACCWPMNPPLRCGRSDVSAASSSRRSPETWRRGFKLTARSSQAVLAAIFVRDQLANRRDRRTIGVGHDDAGVAVVIPDQFAATAARGHDRDRLIGLRGLG